MYYKEDLENRYNNCMESVVFKKLNAKNVMRNILINIH